MPRQPRREERLESQREDRKVRSECAEDTNFQAKLLADALKWADMCSKAENSARARADKLQKLQIEAKTVKLQLEDELAKALACLSLMDAGCGAGVGCSLDIEAAHIGLLAKKSDDKCISTKDCFRFGAVACLIGWRLFYLSFTQAGPDRCRILRL